MPETFEDFVREAVRKYPDALERVMAATAETKLFTTGPNLRVGDTVIYTGRGRTGRKLKPKVAKITAIISAGE